MAKKLISYDDEATGLGLPEVVADRLDTRFALKGDVPTGAVTSQQVTRILTSMNPDMPLEEGDLLLILKPPFNTLVNFTQGLTGWTPRWVTTGWDTSTEGSDGHSIANTLGTGRRALSLDAAGTASDVELVTKVLPSTIDASLNAGLVLRGSGTQGSENGYVCALRELGGTDVVLSISRFTNGTYEAVTTAAFPIPIGQWHWIRFRVNGSHLQAKAWGDGDPEPDAWMIDRVDTSGSAITDAGWCGVFKGGAPQAVWDCVGVAEGGATAPVVAP